MKFLKLIVFSAIILFILITCLGLLMPSTVIVSRAKEINSNSLVVKSSTSSFFGWKNWVQGFSNATIIDSNSAVINKSKMTILFSSATSIEGEWIDNKNNKQIFKLQFIPKNNQQTIVQWQFTQYVSWYPWQRFSLMVNDRVIGDMLEKNLDNLKKLLEKQ